ncbi:MAG: transcriptional regulator [Bacteroidales bacterium]
MIDLNKLSQMVDDFFEKQTPESLTKLLSDKRENPHSIVVNNLDDRLDKLSSGESNWKESVVARQKNKDWLKHSRKIAIKIVRFLKEKNIKQKELAEMLGVSAQQVSKIVKGKENLTLETIANIEKVLNN